MEPVVLLFGPTGVGKTALVDRLFAGRGEVVSADALQVYKSLDIGTAKPDAGLLSRIPHHLINLLHYSQPFNVADFVRLADQAVTDIHRRNRLPVLSGGTAYYFRGWLCGLPETPKADQRIRTEVEDRWASSGNNELMEAVRAVDPVSAERLGAGDRYRMLRVLEVYRQTGRPLSEFPVPDTPREDYRILVLGLRRDRQELYERIDRRVDEMFRQGLAEEVAGLRKRGARPDHPGMKAIGYREWFSPEGEDEPDPEEVRKQIAANSRRYAKRQMTFFSSLPGVEWFDAAVDPDIPGGISDRINSFLTGN